MQKIFNIKLWGLLLLVTSVFFSCKRDDVKQDVKETCVTLTNPNTFNQLGQVREYLLYLPANLPANSPLVFVLHGYTQNAELFYNIGFNKVADTAKFAVCYPQGLNCAWDVNFHNTTDVAFLKALALQLQTQYSLNPDKTFATGFSMGGAMCNLLALDANDVFKAVAPVAGFVYENVWTTRNPLNAIPYFAIHGTADQVVSINGFGTTGVTSIQSITDYWSNQNNCTLTDTVQYTTNTSAYYHRNGINGNEVWFYKISGQDHVFPGDPKAIAYDVSGFNACTEIWKFFRK
jgi:polyhydroxybutyrate depolymerase